MVNGYFGRTMYDMKHMVRVAKMIVVDYATRKCQKVDLDCLFTMHALLKLKEFYFNRECKQELVSRIFPVGSPLMCHITDCALAGYAHADHALADLPAWLLSIMPVGLQNIPCRVPSRVPHH
ncbi:hypothetical protein U1Q18_003082 [Sarracenia purpurea var. burkii]